MKTGMRIVLNRIYVRYLVFLFSLHKFVFGMENANRLLRSCDKRAVIPILRKNGASVGDDCDIESPLIVHNCTNGYGNLKIGNRCHLGKDVFLDLSAPIVIKDHTTISMRVLILSHMDVGRSPLRKCGWKRIKKACILEKGCYVGANAIILHGIKLGECAFIAAGSVVIDHVKPWTIVAGVPARLVRRLDAKRDT